MYSGLCRRGMNRLFLSTDYRDHVMKPVIASLVLGTTLFISQSVHAQQPDPPVAPPVVAPPPQYRAPYQSQIIPDAHTPVAIIQPGPFHPVGNPSPICECTNANKIHLQRIERPWENCNCVNCTSFWCEFRFQWGSCQSFYGEGIYDSNYPVTPETKPKSRISTGNPASPCGAGGCPPGTR